MISVLLIWLNIFITSVGIGFAFFCVVKGFKKTESDTILTWINPGDISITGLLIITVLAEYFSLFYKVGLVFNIIISVASILSFILLFKELKKYAPKRLSFINGKNSIIFLIIFILSLIFMSYGASRGIFHYDSDLYHGQSIRWIEEYGIVKGLALLHSRLAYNSSSFVMSAVYSFSFLGEQSYHAVAGYLAFILFIDCLRVFHVFKDKKVNISDFLRIGGIYYILNIYDEMVSPASDYFVMIYFIFAIIRITDIYEVPKETDDRIKGDLYAYPALLSVFIITLKLSAAPIALLVFIAVFVFAKQKKYNKILIYFVISLAIVIPYLIRNYILSGYLFYPSTFLNIFSPSWKYPEYLAKIDSDYIIAYGRGYNSFEAASLPINVWIKTWIHSLSKTEMLLSVACIISIFALPFSIINQKAFKTIHFIEISVLISLLFWFFSAPLVRYGQGFLIVFPTLLLGDFFCLTFNKSKKTYTIVFSVCLVLFISYKVIGTVKYISGNFLQPYYINQLDYGNYEVNENQIGDNVIYTPLSGDRTGYYAFPSTPHLTEDVTLAGKNIKDGFIIKETK